MDDEEGCSAPKRSRLESPNALNNENINTRNAGDSTQHSTTDKALVNVGHKDLVAEKVAVEDNQSNSINEDEVVNEMPSDSISHAKAVENDCNNLINEVTAADNKPNNSTNPSKTFGDIHNNSFNEDEAIPNNDVHNTHNDPINTKAAEDNLNDVANDTDIVKSIPDNSIIKVDNLKNENKSIETVSNDAVDGIGIANNEAIAVEEISNSIINVTSVPKDSINETTDTVPIDSITEGIADANNSNDLINQEKAHKNISDSSNNTSTVSKNSINEIMSTETILNDTIDDDDSMGGENDSINQSMTAVNNPNYIKSNSKATTSNPNNSANIKKERMCETKNITNIDNVSMKQEIEIPSPSCYSEAADIDRLPKTIRLNDLPESWDDTSVKKFIMRHMGADYKPDNIKYIKKVTYDNDYAPWYVKFTSFHYALKALKCLLHVQEVHGGKKIHIKRKLVSDSEMQYQMVKQSRKSSESEVITNNTTYTLTFTNVPRDYTPKVLINFIKERTDVNPTIMNSITKVTYGSNFTAFVEFSNKYALTEALTLIKHCKNKVYRNGKQLCYVQYKPIKTKPLNTPEKIKFVETYPIKEVKNESTLPSVPSTETPSSSNSSLNCQTKHSKPINNANGVSHFATQFLHDGKKGSVFYNDLNAKDCSDYLAYGLTSEFLQSYNIGTPLKNKVYVDNVNVQYRDELLCRNLFGHAGIVLTLTYVGPNPYDPETFRMTVEYDHPLEAVQAITMFHNQVLLEKKLQVKMDFGTKIKSSTCLPRGLKHFGPGLGFDGLPLRGIRTRVEIEKSKSSILQKIEYLKKDLTQETKDTIIQEINNRDRENTQSKKSNEENQPDASQVITSLVSRMSNSQNNPLMALGGLVPILQLLMQQSAPNTNQGSQGHDINQESGLTINQDRPLSRWDIQPQLGNVAQSSSSQLNASSGPEFQNMQNQGPMQNVQNMGANMQHFAQMEQFTQSGVNPLALQGGLDMQGRENMLGIVNSLAWALQGGYNAQGGQNAQMGSHNMQGIQNPQMGVQGGFIMQGGHNQLGMQGVGSNQMGANILNSQLGAFKSQEEQLQSMAMQGGFNVQGVPNPQLGAVGGFVQGVPLPQTPMQGGYNVQGGQNVQDGRNMQGRQILHGGTNMQGGNMPIIPDTQNVAQVKSQFSPIMQSKKNIKDPRIENQFRSESKVINIAPIKSIGQGSSNYNNEKPKSSVDSDASRTVLFEYLPPSVTQSALEAKMSEIGEIKKAVLTGPGRAMVIFHSLRDADDCIKLLHETKVDGQRITVKAFTAFVGSFKKKSVW